MTPEAAARLIRSIDISKFPSGMNLQIEVDETKTGVSYRVHFTVKSNREPYDTIRLNMPEELYTEEMLEFDIVRRVRNTIAGVLLHELDENLYVDDKRVVEPHYDPNDPDVVLTPCLCNTYICDHSQGRGI